MPPVSSRGPTPISEFGLAPGTRPRTPNLETLAGLLNQNQTASENTMTNIGMFQVPSSSREVSGQGNMSSFTGMGPSGSGSNTPNQGLFSQNSKYHDCVCFQY